MMELDASGGGGLLSSPVDVFTRGGGPESSTSTVAAQRQSPWPLGPSPRTTDAPPGSDRSESAGGGTSTVAVTGVPTAAFSPRIGDGQYSTSRPTSFYGVDTDTSPPRLQPSSDYRPTSGNAVITIAIRLRRDCDTTIRLRSIARACSHSTRFDASKKLTCQFSCRSRIVVVS